MSKIDVSDLTFVQRNVFSCGNAKGTIATVPLTVWRHKDGALYYIPDDPAQLPVLRKLMKMERPHI